MKNNHMLSGRSNSGKKLLAWILGVALFLSGCASEEGKKAFPFGKNDPQTGMQTLPAASGTGSKGRYVEREIPWAQGNTSHYLAGIVPKDGGFYLPDLFYGDSWIGTEGADFTGDDLPTIVDVNEKEFPEAVKKHRNAQDYIADMAMAENGARMYTVFTRSKTQENVFYHDVYFMDAQGSEVLWNADGSVKREDSSSFSYGDDGYFYVQVQKEGMSEGQIYRVNAKNGETQYLFPVNDLHNVTVCNGKLFAETKEEIAIYDLASLEKLPKDPKLTELVKERIGFDNGKYARGFLLYPGENDSLYVVTDRGLYRHVLYGNVSELLIDGTLCSLGDISKLFTDMYVQTKEEGMPVFYFLYDNAKLVRFAYDAEMPSVPEKTLTLYSLYEITDIRLAISAYQERHPQVYVSYEIGVSGEDTVTREDALNSLATRIASGEGPDIFLMDDLPLKSYSEKGILMDLSGVYSELRKEGDYFDNIVEALYTKEQLYTIPMMFYVPLIAGDKEALRKIKDPGSMVRMIEEYPVNKDVLLAGVVTPMAALQCMAYTNCTGWIAQDGSLDRAALANYLTLCKRLYEADQRNISKKRLEYRRDQTWTFGGFYDAMNTYRDSRKMDSMTLSRLVYGDVFAIGLLGGNIADRFNYFYTVLNQADGESDYRLMPGNGKNALPAGLLAINRATQNTEDAVSFVKYILTDYLADAQYLSGTPINKEVLLAMEEEPDEGEEGAHYTYGIGFADENGDMQSVFIECRWQKPEVYERYNALLDSLDSVSLCEYELLSTVMETGVQAVTGEKGIEETVDEIAKKIQLYLAE